MTFDLHLDLEQKAEEFDLWVRRIFAVSSTLSIPYDSLWQMTEHEFLILESLAKEELSRREEKQQEALNSLGKQ